MMCSSSGLLLSPLKTRSAPSTLENPGNIPLEIIEVQSGSYLGEDGIVRFDDV